MTFNFLGPGLTVNVEAKVKEQIILDSSENIVFFDYKKLRFFTKENPALTRADHRSYRCFEVGYPPIRACSAGRYRCAITILKLPVPNVP